MPELKRANQDCQVAKIEEINRSKQSPCFLRSGAPRKSNVCALLTPPCRRTSSIRTNHMRDSILSTAISLRYVSNFRGDRCKGKKATALRLSGSRAATFTNLLTTAKLLRIYGEFKLRPIHHTFYLRTIFPSYCYKFSKFLLPISFEFYFIIIYLIIYLFSYIL